jgi:hypothetical protein
MPFEEFKLDYLDVLNAHAREEATKCADETTGLGELERKIQGYLSAFLFYQKFDKERLHRIAERMAERVQTFEQWSLLVRALAVSSPRLRYEGVFSHYLPLEIIVPELEKLLGLEPFAQEEVQEKSRLLLRFV